MKPIAIFIFLFSISLFSGCSSVAVGTASPDEQDEDKYEAYIEYNSPQIGSRLNITDIKIRKVNELLQASVDLQNNWKWTLDFQYKFRFYDKDGFEVAPEGRPWTPITLSGDETASVQATAPAKEATTFKIFVKD